MEEINTTKAGLRWFTGVPIVTNPLMAMDIASAAILIFGGGVIFIVAGQQIIGEGVTYAALLAAFAYAGYLAVAVIFMFLLVGLFFLNNKYVALFRIDNRGVYSETMRGGSRRTTSEGGFFAFKPYPVEPLLKSGKSSARTLDWEDIRGVQPMESMRVILLKGKRGGTAMKVYCPDAETFQAALVAVRSHLATA